MRALAAIPVLEDGLVRGGVEVGGAQPPAVGFHDERYAVGRIVRRAERVNL